MKTLTAVLFTGGESRRMGADKATLLFHGGPLWSRQLRILREIQPSKIMISARTECVWRPADVEMVLDQPPSRGPLSGLAAALERIQTTHLLALAIDLPQMTSEHLQQLWALADRGKAVIPQAGESLEPLCAIYPVEAMETARAALSEKDVSLKSFIGRLATQKQVRVYAVSEPDRLLYQNVNTPENWKGASSLRR